MASDKQLDALTQDPETRAILQDKGYIDERVANELAARQTGDKLRQEQAAQLQADSAAAVQTPLGQQEAQQGADTLEAAALQGTGINPGFQPIQQPRFAETPNLSPQPMDFTGIPSTLQKPIGDVMASEAAAATEQMAKQEGQKIAAAEQIRREEEVVRAAAEKQVYNENKVKKDLEGSNSNILRNIGDFVAIMVGAAAQAYGAKENPGVEAIEARIKAESEKRKYNMEQEQALRKLALDAAKMKLDQMNALTDNQYKKAQIASLYGKLELERAEAKKSELAAQVLNKPFYTVDELHAVPGKDGEKLRELAVPHPFVPGKFLKAGSSPQATEKLRTFMQESGSIVPEVSKVLDFVTSDDYSKLSLEDRRRVATSMKLLAGSLRIPITGPGPMTDAEREFLLETIGNPNKFITLESLEIASLKGVRDTIKNRINNAYRTMGNIELPASADEDQNMLFERKTGFSKDTIEKARQNILNRKKK